MKNFHLCAALALAGALAGALPLDAVAAKPAAGASAAAELAVADALFAGQQYAQALQKYTKLANAGNDVAQQHLGEMYFYGEAGTVDVDKATQWFTKSAAKGNAVAKASLEMIDERARRRKELDWWISGYDGSDVRTDEYRCPAPRFPAVSKINEEIDSIGARMKNWQNCYNRYVDHLKASAPLTKRIPEDINKLMTHPEIEQAKAHMAQVHEQLTEDAKINGKLVMADYNVWRNATEAYIAEHNDILKNSPPSEEDLQSLREKRNAGK